jgi:glycosyltransferase involved in cell wall biosynthesis
MYENIAILKHPGYNVAYWNLVQRLLTRHPEGYRVNGQPLAFFHFSGLNILAPENLSKYQNRFTMHDLGDGQKLIEDYCATVLGNGYAALSQIPYAYGFFEDGKPIVDDMRQAYRTHAEIQEKLGPNPFATGSSYPWELPGRLDLDWRRQKFGRVRRLLRPAVRWFPASWRHRVKTALKQILFRPPRETAGPIPTLTSLPSPRIKDGSKRSANFLPGLNLVGYIRSEHGIGESARLCAMSADAARLPFSLYDFNVGNNSRTGITDWDHKIGQGNEHQVNVFHINADQMPLAWQHLGEDFFAGHYNVGFWHWELPEFPDAWTPSFQLVDEIWAPTVFVQESLSRKAPVPVVRMPHAVRFSIRPGLRRSDRQLPEGMFLFLTMYDTHSVQMRKNPRAVITAFQKAFPNSAEVGLVVKINNPTSYPEEVRQLRASLKAIRGIHVIDHIMSRQEVYELEALCDGYVSLHRSEGFGLGLAESMYLGKPVIGTNWSGNVDFMRVDNSCPVHFNLIPLDRDYGPYGKGQVWADPDLDQAAWYMRRLVEDAGWRKFLAARGQQTIRTQFSPEVVGAMYRQRLAVIGRFTGIPKSQARPAA